MPVSKTDVLALGLLTATFGGLLAIGVYSLMQKKTVSAQCASCGG